MPDSTATAPTTTADPAAPAAKQAKPEKPRGLWGDAWRDLRRRPLFLISAAIIFLLLLVVAVPQLFTSVDPNISVLAKSRQGPSAEAWFGYDVQGRDIYSRAIYGARASIAVGLLATLGTVLIGSVVGIIGGYYGGWLDNLLSRFSEIFLGLPFVLGAIVILTTFNQPGETPSGTRVVLQVVISIALLSWPIAMRIMRSAAISASPTRWSQPSWMFVTGTARARSRHMPSPSARRGPRSRRSRGATRGTFRIRTKTLAAPANGAPAKILRGNFGQA